MDDNPARNASARRMPTVYLPHGGGPCFFMDPPPQAPQTWDGMAAYLRGLAASIGERPRALLVVSAHWETPRPTVNSGAAPGMLFDYYGFPAHTYQLSWPAPGSPPLAAKVRDLLQSAGIDCDEDAARGYDHGVFVPLLLAWPDADIPTTQLSLQAGLDPAAHLAIGKALEPLRDEGVLIIGSGMSYHNLREFFAADARVVADAEQFDTALTAALLDPVPAAREAQLIRWKSLPAALAAHPRAEHLLPLMVVAGAAGNDPGRRMWTGPIFGKPVSAFHFG
ncbi:DODA-type extradiol aromatic ring-opening family dioxygenase [Dokdonella sp.]|uniref:DODA-type extradiol aromatic ring-opening family dioxygenase n=1 Tax=Dokdonella sp. TaxID=2291710 RepID=UPI0037830403